MTVNLNKFQFITIYRKTQNKNYAKIYFFKHRSGDWLMRSDDYEAVVESCSRKKCVLQILNSNRDYLKSRPNFRKITLKEFILSKMAGLISQ